MTEAEWVQADEPTTMLASLPCPCPRKLTLYLCAGARTLWELLYDPRSRRAVEVLERQADGKATADEVKRASYDAESPTFGFHFEPSFVRTYRASASEREGIANLLAMGVYTEQDLLGEEPLGDKHVSGRLGNLAYLVYLSFWSIEHGQVCESLLLCLRKQREWPTGDLVREIFGNPFRPCHIKPAWRTSTVTSLAQAIYDERAFDRLPILADALEDAGCDNAHVLAHCRSGGEHVRGCWVVDLVLGKS